MWNKLKEYYTDINISFMYGDAIILHPSLKMSWFKKQGWKQSVIDGYQQSARERFERNYSNAATTSILNNRKRTHSMIESESEENEQSEFDSYIKSKRIKAIDNSLIWWATSHSIFPQMGNMIKDIYAVPATGSGVEREFSISDNIVNHRRNRLKPKTISDLMQYKRWLDRHGLVSEFLHEQEINEDDSEIESVDGSDEGEEANQELIEWLRDWEEAGTLNERVNSINVV